MRLTRVVPGFLVLSFLATFVAAPAPAQATPWKENDGSDDLRASDSPVPVPVPSHLDLRSLSIHSEDEISLVMDIGLADFEASSGGASISFGDGGDLVLEFALAGSEVTYRLEILVFGSTTPGATPVVWNAFVKNFCVDLGDGECRVGRPRVDLDYQANVVRVTFTKADLRGEGFGVFFGERRGPSPSPGGGDGEEVERPALPAGSKFTNFAVEARGYIGFVEVEDHLPDEGTIERPFTLAYAVANLGLSVSVDLAWDDEFAVVPGENQTVPFRVTNHAGPKRLVLLTYEFVGADVAGYRIVAPANISIPSLETREFRAYVFTPETLKPAKLLIKGRSVGLADLGMAKVHLIPGLPLGPETPPLKILQYTSNNPYANLCYGCFTDAILYPGTTYDTYSAQGEMPMPWTSATSFVTPARSADQIYLKPATPVEVELKVVSGQAREGVSITVQLDYMGMPLLSATEEKDVGTEGAVFTFKKVPKLHTKVLPSQGRLTLRVSGPGGSGLPVDQVTGMRIDLSESSVKIPFAPVPDEYLEKPLASPFQLGVLGEREDFVNPGEARLFNVTILNFDGREQRLHLSAAITPPTWGVEVLPGRLFELRSGESVTIGVLVRPSPDANENDRASISLNASADNGAYTPLRLAAIVTSQLPLEDDTNRYIADEDDLEKQLDKDPLAKTPGAAFDAVLAAWSAAAMGRRRRPPANP